jgi:hypothetical protein
MNELSELFKLVAQEKKQKKEEYQSLVGDLGLDSIFEEVSILKTKSKIKNKKGHKALKVFEDFLSSNEIESINEEVIEEIVEVVEELQEELEEPKKPTLIEKSLGLLAEPSDVKVQQDPITPLDQKFATLEDLQKHYSTFLSRIQQQLSTIGGGGETKLRYLDDVVGIATNSGAYNGKYLQWNSATNRAEFTDPSDAETTTVVFVTGITTYYQATNTDDYIGVSANVPVTIQLPTSPIVGKKITVKDEGNKISLHNITVTVGAGVSVENDTSVVMKINHQSFTFFYNSQNWFLV